MDTNRLKKISMAETDKRIHAAYAENIMASSSSPREKYDLFDKFCTEMQLQITLWTERLNQIAPYKDKAFSMLSRQEQDDMEFDKNFLNSENVVKLYHTTPEGENVIDSNMY